MEGVSRAVGSGVPIRMGGKMLVLPPMTLADIGCIENYLLLQRRDLKRVALAKVRPDDDKEVVDKIVAVANELSKNEQHYIRTSDIAAFLGTPMGLALSMWLPLQRAGYELSLEEVLRHITSQSKEGLATLITARDLASGVHEYATRDWTAGLEKGSSPPGRINWKHLVRMMCEAYLGLTPNDVGNMTLYQFRLMAVSSEETKSIKIPLSQWRTMQQKTRKHSGGRR